MAGLGAVAGPGVVADGNQYFNRPGPRLVEWLEILAEALHPGALPPRHRGSGWVGLAAGAAFLLNRGAVCIPFFITRPDQGRSSHGPSAEARK